jgi:hypothetical protein
MRWTQKVHFPSPGGAHGDVRVQLLGQQSFELRVEEA